MTEKTSENDNAPDKASDGETQQEKTESIDSIAINISTPGDGESHSPPPSDAEENRQSTEDAEQDRPDASSTETENSAFRPGTLGEYFGGFGHGRLPHHQPKSKWPHILYVALLVGGFFIIVLSKSGFGVDERIMAGFAAVSIVSYGCAAGFLYQRHNPIGADRVGDNCYYLGLTYTLGSLISSLISLQNSTYDGRELLGNFGIALVSTAVGIIMRLVLMQFRTEIDEVESEARMRLIEASEIFRQQLFTSKSDFENYRRSLLMGLEATQSELTEFFKTQSSEIASLAREPIEQLKVRVEDVEAVFGQIEKELSTLSAKTENLGEATSRLAARIDDIHVNPKRFEENIDDISEQLARSSELLADASTKFETSATSVRDMSKVIANSEAMLVRINDAMTQFENIAGSRAEILKAEAASVADRINALKSMAGDAEQEAERIRQTTGEVFDALGSLAKSVVDGVRRV